jgi:hypothetical protein|tara:strand:- start:12889 stop:13125 length:237 start_codon:yes stop_codon:yes gene_type:complete
VEGIMSESANSILGDGVECVLTFDYQSYEPQTQTYPGAYPSATLENVEVSGVSVIDDLSNDCQKRLEQECLERMGGEI